MSLATSKSNPFPVEAVATFGRLPLASYEALTYFLLVREELLTYLSSYVKPEIRYGGAIGLRGSHGAGKTHLLQWIATQTRMSRQARAVVVYAKADSDSLFDLCTTLIAGISAEDFKRLIGEALRQLAIRYVGRAQATESITARLDSSESLSQLYQEENLDESALRQTLENELAATGIPEEIRRAIMLLDSAQAGDKVYQWLLGRRVESLGQLALPYQLSDVALQNKVSAASEVLALDMLEGVAALCRIAETPFVILIDQMEVLFETPSEHLSTLQSLTKKLFEQIGGQDALLFIAGTDDAWSRVRRDVGPRLRTREPIDIGHLSTTETSALLIAYMSDQAPFGPDTMEMIWRLSGGNPREILSISYNAYQISNGNVASLTGDAVLESARRSGSLRDRQKVALQIIDGVLGGQAHGRLFQDLFIDEVRGVKVDRLLEVNERPALLAKVLAAADRVAEAELAKDITLLASASLAKWPSLHIAVVSVGYSSAQVARLVGSPPGVTIVEFDERDFAGRLQTILVDALQNTDVSDTSHREKVDVARVTDQLSHIREERERGDEKIQSKTSEYLGEAASPIVQERERKTRREIIESLDDLLYRIPAGDLTLERDVVRSALITNEAYVRNGFFEQLGDIYLDVISTARMLSRDDPLSRECQILRQNLAQRMIETLRGSSLGDTVRGLPVWKASFYILVVSTALTLILTFFWAVMSFYPVHSYDSPSTLQIIIGALRRWGLQLFATCLMGLYTIYFALLINMRRWGLQARQLRRAAVSSIGKKSPANTA